jgi:hypothetical protein
MYTDTTLNVYKTDGGLVLSSFENFNSRCAGFQQLPWMANISGIGIRTQSYGEKNSIAGFDMIHTHQPRVHQQGGTLIASYSTPSELKTWVMRSVFNRYVQLFWPPSVCFDEMRIVKKKFMVNFDLNVWFDLIWRHIDIDILTDSSLLHSLFALFLIRI